MSETLGLKNVNLLSKEQYVEIDEPVTDELWAISGSGFGFPSNRYVDLELGASDSTYTAPANGWVYLSKNATATGQYIQINQRQYALSILSPGSSRTLRFLAPVVKGSFTVSYNAGGSIGSFKFIYAEGEES